MLTREHGIVEFDFETGVVTPDRLVMGRHRHYLDFAEQMLVIYREGIGRCRQDLHFAVAQVLSSDSDFHERRIGAFCKLLDEVSEYGANRSEAWKLRSRVFQAAAKAHPLVRQRDECLETESTVKSAIAEELNTGWQAIADSLFADVIQFHRLTKFNGYSDARALLSRYNVAQVQTALFDAVRLRVHATRNYKQVLRYAKLAGLMHRIRRRPDGAYDIELDGPASILTATRRYGVSMAKFVPGLLSCQDWALVADIRRKHWSRSLRLTLSTEDGLSGKGLPPEEFDSSVEEAFFKKWGAEPRNGWRLEREPEILHAGQHCFFPDFAFTHENGRRVFLEVIGFWTEKYLTGKFQTLQRFPGIPIILAVRSSSVERFQQSGSRIIEFKTTIGILPVLEELARTLPGRL